MSSQEVRTRSVAAAADEWFALRARAEQLVAETNGALAGQARMIELVDEAGTGVLAFVLRHGPRSVRVSMGRYRRRGWVEVEATDDSVLEDLIDMLRGERSSYGADN